MTNKVIPKREALEACDELLQFSNDSIRAFAFMIHRIGELRPRIKASVADSLGPDEARELEEIANEYEKRVNAVFNPPVAAGTA